MSDIGEEDFGDLSINMLAANLVDEYLKVVELRKKYLALKAKITQDSLVCPHCQGVMEKVHYVTYYDETVCWICDCEDSKGLRKIRGSFA